MPFWAAPRIPAEDRWSPRQVGFGPLRFSDGGSTPPASKLNLLESKTDGDFLTSKTGASKDCFRRQTKLIH